MTLGSPDGAAETWIGNVVEWGGNLLVACERDVEHERILQQRLLHLTDEYAEAERELGRTHRKLQSYAEQLEQLSLTDALTGLPNRRRIDDLLNHELESAQRYGEPLSLMLLDLDRFKRVNDTFGHSYGDEVLRGVARAMTRSLRKTDVAARWGGEEFCILVPNTPAEGAHELAQRVRAAIKESPAEHGPVTVSIGISEARPGDSVACLLERADDALYRAKEAGRDRVVVARVDDSSPDATGASSN